MRTTTQWVVQFEDGSTETVVIPAIDYQSEDHIYEAVAKASSNPDLVDDFWRQTVTP